MTNDNKWLLINMVFLALLLLEKYMLMFILSAPIIIYDLIMLAKKIRNDIKKIKEDNEDEK